MIVIGCPDRLPLCQRRGAAGSLCSTSRAVPWRRRLKLPDRVEPDLSQRCAEGGACWCARSPLAIVAVVAFVVGIADLARLRRARGGRPLRRRPGRRATTRRCTPSSRPASSGEYDASRRSSRRTSEAARTATTSANRGRGQPRSPRPGRRERGRAAGDASSTTAFGADRRRDRGADRRRRDRVAARPRLPGPRGGRGAGPQDRPAEARADPRRRSEPARGGPARRPGHERSRRHRHRRDLRAAVGPGRRSWRRSASPRERRPGPAGSSSPSTRSSPGRRAASCSPRAGEERARARLAASRSRASPCGRRSTRSFRTRRPRRSATRSAAPPLIDAKNGDVLALAGLAFSAPQPPGSTFKVITLTGALEEEITKPEEEFPVATSAIVGGREVFNADDEACGGNLVDELREVVQQRLRAARRGARRRAAGRDLRAVRLQRAALASTGPRRSPPSSRPRAPFRPTSPTARRASARSGRERCSRRRSQMASISQAIANGGVRSPTSIVRDPELAGDYPDVTVTDPKTADVVQAT